jgi:epoxyqueuosine reductase
VRFAQELREPAFAARESLGGRDVRTLARELLAMSQAEFSAAFEGRPMKRAKLPRVKRNAAVVAGNVGTHGDVDVLTDTVDDDEPLVREHAGRALRRITGEGGASARPSAEEADSEARDAVDVRR